MLTTVGDFTLQLRKFKSTDRLQDYLRDLLQDDEVMNMSLPRIG